MDNERSNELEMDAVSCTEERMSRLTVDDLPYRQVQPQKQSKTGHEKMQTSLD